MNARLIHVPALGNANYAMAAEVPAGSRLLFVSGQVPVGEGGEVPDDFVNQARLAWRNLGLVLAGAGMTFANLVKVTTFLSDRAHREANKRVREEVLGDHMPALTVIIAGIYDERWLLEIEAVAAD